MVLGGDYTGRRLRKAMDLLEAGYAPRILISGPLMIYGERECVLAAKYAVAHGIRPDQVIPFIREDESTADEARDIIPELKRMGVHRYLLVTSTFHTARAHRIFHRQDPSLEMRSIASPDRHEWCGGYWWTERECRKTWLLETTKTIADWFRL